MSSKKAIKRRRWGVFSSLTIEILTYVCLITGIIANVLVIMQAVK